MAVKLPENNRHWTTNWEFRVSDKPPTTNVYAGHGDFSGTTNYKTFVAFHNAVAAKQKFINANEDHKDGSMLVKAGDTEVIIVFGREQDRVAVINLKDEKYASATFGANGDIKPGENQNFNDLLKLVLNATKQNDGVLKDAGIDLSNYNDLGAKGDTDTLELIGIGITDGILSYAA